MNLITCEIESRKLVFVCIQIIVVLKMKKFQCDIQTKEYRLVVEFQHSSQSRCPRALAKIPYPFNTQIKGYFFVRHISVSSPLFLLAPDSSPYISYQDESD